VITNLPFLRALARNDAVRAGAFDTEWIEREFLAGFEALAQAPTPELAVAAAALAELLGLATPARSSAHGAGNDNSATSDPFVTLGAWRLPGLA